MNVESIDQCKDYLVINARSHFLEAEAYSNDTDLDKYQALAQARGWTAEQVVVREMEDAVCRCKAIIEAIEKLFGSDLHDTAEVAKMKIDVTYIARIQ